MLMDLKREFKEGESVPLTHTVETAAKRETIELQVPVRALNTRGAPTRQEHKH